MFNDSGVKIKKIAVILFWLSTISYVILAFFVGWREEMVGYYYSHSETVFHPELFFPLFIGGPVCSYVTCLLLAGFGDLIENTTEIKLSLKKQSPQEYADLPDL